MAHKLNPNPLYPLFRYNPVTVTMNRIHDALAVFRGGTFCYPNGTP